MGRMRRLGFGSVLIVGLLLALCVRSGAQDTASATNSGTTAPAAAPTAFDVITVKPHKANGDDRESIMFREDAFQAENVALPDLLQSAYRIREDLISGVPKWAASTRWDISAKLVDTPPAVLKQMTDEQKDALLASILRDRFHTRVHQETKQLPVYDLVVSKGGAKMAENAAAHGDELKPFHGHGCMRGPAMMMCNGIDMPRLTWMLGATLNRTVIDKTGLTGTYSFTLKWDPQDEAVAPMGAGIAAPQGDSGPSIFTAMEEQLGLKLERAKGPVVTLVVDQMEMPTEN